MSRSHPVSHLHRHIEQFAKILYLPER